jgi:hypothetical protein
MRRKLRLAKQMATQILPYAVKSEAVQTCVGQLGMKLASQLPPSPSGGYEIARPPARAMARGPYISEQSGLLPRRPASARRSDGAVSP